MRGNLAGIALVSGTTVVQTPQNADVARALQQAQVAQQQAVDAARDAAQAAAQAGRDAALQGARAAAEAQRAAADAQRQATREIIRAQIEQARSAARRGQPEIAFPPFGNSGPQIPEGAVVISVAFFVMCAVIAIGIPLARAIARRMDRKSLGAPAADSDTRARLERIEQAVDAIAVEVERISEGQRFTTKVMADLRALPQPDASSELGGRSGAPLSRAREAR